mmetsp:Transcript_37850/g.67630  ORF Transcript_37850/g.67630 Transcript_37850/m.67630 type:complete len:117 (-) Transcript_37850:43-393(-)
MTICLLTRLIYIYFAKDSAALRILAYIGPGNYLYFSSRNVHDPSGFNFPREPHRFSINNVSILPGSCYLYFGTAMVSTKQGCDHVRCVRTSAGLTTYAKCLSSCWSAEVCKVASPY